MSVHALPRTFQHYSHLFHGGYLLENEVLEAKTGPPLFSHAFLLPKDVL